MRLAIFLLKPVFEGVSYDLIGFSINSDYIRILFPHNNCFYSIVVGKDISEFLYCIRSELSINILNIDPIVLFIKNIILTYA